MGSFNYHQDFFGKSLNITDSAKEPAHTGCFGFGLERLAMAFLAQHGPNSEAWPATVVKGVGRW